MPDPALMIEAHDLHKRYGETQALAGVDLEVPAGSILALLGPNGAGKTTAVRVLTTLALPDSGQAFVAGHDVVADPVAVRRSIGVTAQQATVDESLTGRQNLSMVGILSGMSRRDARAQADELLERFGLLDAADRVLKGYSGGMRRRIDLAAGIVTRPPVLFLDEPTTGLDPVSRQGMWEIINELVAEGTTLLLTTQYLEEADQLADRIAVVDHGRVIAEGTASELKSQIGGGHLEVTLTMPDPAAVRVLESVVGGTVAVSDDGRRLMAGVKVLAPGFTTTIVRALDVAGISVDDVEVRQPSLDDVFFSLTGHGAEEAGATEPDAVLEGASA